MRLSAPREVFAGLFETVGAISGGPKGDALVLSATREGVRMVGIDSANVVLAVGEVPARSFARFDLPALARENGGESVGVDTGKLAGFLRRGPSGKGAALAEWSLSWAPVAGRGLGPWTPGKVHLSTRMEGTGRLSFECAPVETRRIPTLPTLELPEPVTFGPEDWVLFRSAVTSAAEVSDFLALGVSDSGLTVRAMGDTDGTAQEIPVRFPRGWDPGRGLYTTEYMGRIVKALNKIRPSEVALTFRPDYPMRLEARTEWGGRFSVLLAPRIEEKEAPAAEEAPAEVAEEKAPAPAPVGPEEVYWAVRALSAPMGLFVPVPPEAPEVAPEEVAAIEEAADPSPERPESLEEMDPEAADAETVEAEARAKSGVFTDPPTPEEEAYYADQAEPEPAEVAEAVRFRPAAPVHVCPCGLPVGPSLWNPAAGKCIRCAPLPVAPIGPIEASPTPGPTGGGEAERAREGTPTDVAGATPTAAPSPTSPPAPPVLPLPVPQDARTAPAPGPTTPARCSRCSLTDSPWTRIGPDGLCDFDREARARAEGAKA